MSKFILLFYDNCVVYIVIAEFLQYVSAGSDYYNRNDMSNVMADHAAELASWGLGDYGDIPPSPYDAPKYTYSSSPSQYESVGNKYGPPSGPPIGPPQSVSPYSEKYINRVDNINNQVSFRTLACRVLFRNSCILLITRKWKIDLPTIRKTLLYVRA